MTTPYDPAPDEIAAGCQRLQEGWTKAAERKHRTGTAREVRYEVPMVAERDLMLNPSIDG